MDPEYTQIFESTQRLYLDDPRPRLVGFSRGKDSTMVASLVAGTVMAIPPEQRVKDVVIVCTDTRVETRAIVETIESALARITKLYAGTFDAFIEAKGV